MSDTDLFESQSQSQKTYSKGWEYAEHSDDSDIVPATPIKETKKKIRKKKPRFKDIVIDYDENFKFNIKIPKTGSSYNKTFVFHYITEALKYTPQCFPKNNNIHLVGVHKFSKQLGHYLEKCGTNLDHVSIPLDFTVSKGIPDENDTVSVYGSVEFFNNTSPTFVVKFFRKEVNITAHQYMDYLYEIRNYVPRDFVSTICNNN